MSKERISQLENYCRQYNLTLVERSPGHYQVSGHGVCVNYWPHSKKRSAQPIGEPATPYCDPFDVIQLAMGKAKQGLRPKAAKEIAKQKNPPDMKDGGITNPAGIRDFYTGERPPWEFDSFVSSAADLMRIDAYRKQCEAEALRFQADAMTDPANFRRDT